MRGECMTKKHLKNKNKKEFEHLATIQKRAAGPMLNVHGGKELVKSKKTKSVVGI